MSKKILLEQISMCLDGGTTIYVEPHVKENIKSIDEARDCQKFYVDHRIGTETDGELFDRYPDEEGAIMLDKTKYKLI